MRCLRWTAALLIGGVPSVMTAESPPADSPAVQIFHQLDRNGDGRVTAEEVPAAQMEFFERLLRIGDRNGDGILTQKEFLRAIGEGEPTDSPGEEPAPVNPNSAGSSRESRADEGKDRQKRSPGPNLEVLRRLDTNGDGKLSREEVPEGLRNQLNGFFDRLGADELDLEQLAEFARQRSDGGATEPGEGERSPWPRERTEPEETSRAGNQPVPLFFRILDTDGNGRLSKEEMLNATRLFEKLDRNGDGELDLSELMGTPEVDSFHPPRKEEESGSGGSSVGRSEQPE